MNSRRILDALEQLGEALADEGATGTVFVHVGRDHQVDLLAAGLGQVVNGRRFPPPSKRELDGVAWRGADTAVAGVGVGISGPHRRLGGPKSA